MPSSVKVATFFSQTDALIAAEYLRANGLVTTVMGDDAGGAFSGITLSKGFRLYVPAADEAIAIELLETPPPTNDGGGNENTAAESSEQDDQDISQAEY